MISVILYGRNDSHGYNLHKRAAISLNAIAAVLSDPDDEILFVDYNTPVELPTFIEAIYDTLTLAAKARLRVFRVRPEFHQRLGLETHLVALEPHSRNIAIRRSNPNNPWLLLTNTDMIFLPRRDVRDLTGAVRGLADGWYALPRFELPEPLWEQFPRSDPSAILDACRTLGPGLHLDEVTASLPFSRFDQVGDFQLVPRQTMFAIHGFDERMIHGWHCDSNVAKRLYLYYCQATGSLADRLKGYHCDHTRLATRAHRIDKRIDNNVRKFVFEIEDPVAPGQAETWGAPAENIEELDFARDPHARYISALQTVLGLPQPGDYFADSNDLRNYVGYCAPHVLPHLAANLTVYPRSARFSYVGVHRQMRELIGRTVAELGFDHPLETTVSDPGKLLANYDLVIFDFGLDDRNTARVTDWPREQRYRLGEIASLLKACSDCANTQPGSFPDFLAINANHHTFRRFAGHFLLLTDTPFTTRVRRGRLRIGEERVAASEEWTQTENEMRSFFAYGLKEKFAPMVALDSPVDFTSAGQPELYKDGNWGLTDASGSWTDGERAVLEFRPPAEVVDDLVLYVRVSEAFLPPAGDPIRVQILLDGTSLAQWSFSSRSEVLDCRVTLPAAMWKGEQTCRLEFHIANPHSPQHTESQPRIGEDPRLLGIKVQRLLFRAAASLPYTLGRVLEFQEGSFDGLYAREGWSNPDDRGLWTVGPVATLVLPLRETPAADLTVDLTVTDCAVEKGSPQRVNIKANGRDVAQWNLESRRSHRESFVIPSDVAAAAELTLTFHISNPRSPQSLGWNEDSRPLGFHLSRLTIGAVRSGLRKLLGR